MTNDGCTTATSQVTVSVTCPSNVNIVLRGTNATVGPSGKVYLNHIILMWL